MVGTQILNVADCHGGKMPRTAILYRIGESIAARSLAGAGAGVPLIVLSVPMPVRAPCLRSTSQIRLA